MLASQSCGISHCFWLVLIPANWLIWFAHISECFERCCYLCEGEVALPGGKRDKQDANNAETALREAHEEIGLDSSLVRVVAYIEPFLSKVKISYLIDDRFLGIYICSKDSLILPFVFVM